jgi:hypothetical protein
MTKFVEFQTREFGRVAVNLDQIVRYYGASDVETFLEHEGTQRTLVQARYAEVHSKILNALGVQQTEYTSRARAS